MHAYIPGKMLGGIQVFVAYHEDSGDLLIYYKEQSNSDFLHQKNPLFDLRTKEILMNKAKHYREPTINHNLYFTQKSKSDLTCFY